VILDCVLAQDDATVKCWGWNGAGELGQGDTSTRGDDANGPCPPSSIHHCGSRACPQVFSLLLQFLACRDGDEPPVGRPWGWEHGRSRLRGGVPFVRSAGKVAQWEIGGRGPSECVGWNTQSKRPLLPNLICRPRLRDSRLKNSEARIWSNTTLGISATAAPGRKTRPIRLC